MIEHLSVFRRKGGKLEFKPILVELTVAKPSDAIQLLHGGATWALNQIVGSHRGYVKNFVSGGVVKRSNCRL